MLVEELKMAKNSGFLFWGCVECHQSVGVHCWECGGEIHEDCALKCEWCGSGEICSKCMKLNHSKKVCGES